MPSMAVATSFSSSFAMHIFLIGKVPGCHCTEKSGCLMHPPVMRSAGASVLPETEGSLRFPEFMQFLFHGRTLFSLSIALICSAASLDVFRKFRFS